jgi:hypothetical protein
VSITQVSSSPVTTRAGTALPASVIWYIATPLPLNSALPQLPSAQYPQHSTCGGVCAVIPQACA